MKILSSLSRYVLKEHIDISHPLFTYFTPHYEIDKSSSNPFIKLSLLSKLKGVETLIYIQYQKGDTYSYCAFCDEKDCSHLNILVTYLFQDEKFINDITNLEEYFSNYEKMEQQNSFDIELKQYLKDISEENTLLKGHIEPYFYDARNSYYLEGKIGIGKYYKIPNMSRFIDLFASKESRKYGKDLIFVHKLSNLDKPSQELVKTLFNKKLFMTLEDEQIDDICNGYISNTIYIDDIPYIVSDDIIPYKIKIDDKYHLSFISVGNNYKPFGKYHLIDINNKKIYKYDYDEHISKLVNIIHHYPLADIKDNLMDFKYTYLIKYPDVFEIDDGVKTILNDDNFKIKSYLDYEDKKIILTYKTLLDNKEIDISEIDSFTIRKIYEAYLNVLDRYGFNLSSLTIDSEIDVFNFLNSSLEDLKNISEVYISENLSNKKISIFSSPSVSIKREGSLLSILLDNSLYSEEELKEIYLAIKKKKRYVLIKDNFLDLSNESASNFANIVSSFDLFNNKKILKENHLPLYYAFKKLGIEEEEVEMDNYIDTAFNEVKNYANNNITLPKINGKLRSYQKEGVKWLYTLYKNELGGILADDMGLGKTIEAITFIKLINNKENSHLIVCPKSLIFNWISEFKKFAPEINTYAINGTINQRKEIIDNINNNPVGVYFISYDSLRNEIKNLKDISFDICILDEAQFIKNAFAKKTESVKEINAKHHFALTGTPIENNIYDMWSIFDFLMPGYLGQLKIFQEQYEHDESYKDKLKTIIAPFVLRRKKEDVLKDLPDKYEVLYTVEMTSSQRKMYDAHILMAKESMNNSSNKDMIKILALLTRLRQLCVHPSLFVDKYSGGSGKIDALKEIILNKINDNHRILLFSQFVTALEIIKEELDKLNISYKVITGDTGAKERLDIANEFNNNEDIKLVLISLKAGGTGLNLIGADTVIHLDPWWNLAAENQASDRAHRIGQTRAVEVIKLIAEKSIEQRVIELQNEKKELVNKMISDNDESIKKLSLEDLKTLLGNIS